MSFDIVFQQTQDSKKHSDRPISNAAFPVKYRLGKSAVAQIHREGICPMYKRDSRGVRKILEGQRQRIKKPYIVSFKLTS